MGENNTNTVKQNKNGVGIGILPVILQDLREAHDILGKNANAILDNAEHLMAKATSSDDSARLMNICESCNFHDLAGQRILRIIANLEQLAKELINEGTVVAQDDYNSANMLSGPALSGKGQTQGDVDKLFK